MNPKKCFDLKLHDLHYTASLSDKCRNGHRYVTITVEGHADASVTMALDVFRLMLEAINLAGLASVDPMRLFTAEKPLLDRLAQVKAAVGAGGDQ